MIHSVSLGSLVVQPCEEEKKLAWTAANISELTEKKVVDLIDPDTFIADIHEEMDVGFKIST